MQTGHTFTATKITPDLLQRLWDLLSSFDAVALQQLIQHSLPAGQCPFIFLTPPQVQTQNGTVRQRATGDGCAGARNFTSYGSSNAIAVADSTDSTRFIVFCKQQQASEQPNPPLGSYRLYVLATTAATSPDNVHKWPGGTIQLPVKQKIQAWVDTTVGLCVWEPASKADSADRPSQCPHPG